MEHTAKYTKGPWEAFTEDSFSGWWAIRQVTDDGLNHEIGSTDGGFDEADARLMAAAPDLLEALQEAKKQFIEYTKVVPVLQYYVDICEKAIAKALGQP